MSGASPEPPAVHDAPVVVERIESIQQLGLGTAQPIKSIVPPNRRSSPYVPSKSVIQDRTAGNTDGTFLWGRRPGTTWG